MASDPNPVSAEISESRRLARRDRSQVVGFVIVAGAFVCLFWSVLAQGKNFSYRDGAHYYYPLYKFVQAEWSAGRLPLWNAFENCGTPLAANPTSAAFYPAKILFAVLPYATAYKAYILLHLILAVTSANRCARYLGADAWGGLVAGIAYGFGGFVLFQSYNVVFLCGAAWLPLGIHAGLSLVDKGPSTSASSVWR